MLYSFNNKSPKFFGQHYYIADSAEIIGEVVIHNQVCILPKVVIRADNDRIEIGEGSNIQDGAILHTDAGIPLIIGKNVSIAHGVILHGCHIDDGSVIGMGAVVMNRVKVGKNCMIGAKTLLSENMIIPDNSLVIGMPGIIKRQLTSQQIDSMKHFAEHYIEKIDLFKQQLSLISR